jgi:signal transduction histidine kinase/ActR/RegA family two-component response regulator
MSARPVPHYKHGATLHSTLLITALIVVSIAAAVMIGSVTLAMSWRDDMERDSEALLHEQKIADQILALTYEQQLAAYRYLQTPDTLHLGTFRVRGDSVYREIQSYLFHELSPDARLQVESIKEEHQQFEVAAERAFDLAKSGHLSAALERRQGLDERASGLELAVGQFLQARLQQRDAFRRQYDVLSRRLHIGLGLVAFGLIVLGFVVSRLLRLRVLRPLHDLASVARRLGEGEAGARVPPQPYEEFDAVGIGFNHMADRVQASTEKTEARNQELREALDHLRSTQEELVQHEKLSAVGQMLAGLAHELNNPLGGILGMAECLRIELAESAHAETRVMGLEMAAPLEREARRANALVRSLLSFARKPGGALESVGLAAAVSTAVGLRAHAFAQAGKILNVDVSQDLYVIADAQKLQHAVVNLVNNALDAIVTASGAALDIRASRDGDDFVRLDFDDDGTGIANLEAAFTPFYTTKEAGKGTGLGLMLVRRFVNEFGGSVTAVNLPARGARVTVRLRRGKVPLAESSPPHENGTPTETAAQHDASRSLRAPQVSEEVRQRVLVVDDEPAIREIQRRLLTRVGIDVLLAISGTEARDIMLREHVDLVVSDLRMPGEMDGYALLRWMADNRPALAESALLATGDMGGTASVALPVPVERILSKPFEAVEFVQRVRAALGVSGGAAL